MAKFGVPSDRSLSKLLIELPDGATSAVRGWFDLLSKMENGTRDNFIKSVLDPYKRDEVPDVETISTELDGLELPTARANELAHGMRTMALLLSARNESAEDFVIAAKEANIIEEKQEAATMAFAENVINQREIIAEAIERITLANAVLPSMTSLDYTVDVRIELVDGHVERAVPVVIFRLDADIYKEEMFFQLNKRQLARLIKELQEAQNQVEIAERWISTKP